MTVSTVTLDPGAPAAAGSGVSAEATATSGLVDRAARADFDTWIGRATSAGACSRPIRLAGQLRTVDTSTGEFRSAEAVPDGALYTACGDRRASVCPACAETYRADTYQLVRAGLAGGKGVPDSVASHPAVFATFTAPSFGPVHARRLRSGRVLACRPRRKPEICPHGRDLRCQQVHGEGESCLGRPLCPDCYDYAGAVVWNAHAPELWRRTTMALRRILDRAAKTHGGGRVKVAYAKVAEFQGRGLVHFHALIRLDGLDPDDTTALVAPPAGLTARVLDDAIRQAVYGTWFATLPHPDKPDGWDIAWGSQLDVRTVHSGIDSDITDQAVAAYLAKYATKSTEAVGTVSARITPENLDLYADTRTHAGRLIRAAWDLGTAADLPDDFRALRRWAHMLGFRGHFSTKSRRYSTTLGALRQARSDYRRRQAQIRARDHQDADEETTLVIGLLSYAGTGWRTTADALLAQTAAARARERHRIARDELACID